MDEDAKTQARLHELMNKLACQGVEQGIEQASRQHELFEQFQREAAAREAVEIARRNATFETRQLRRLRERQRRKGRTT